MNKNTNLPRGGGVVFDPNNLKKVSAVINKEGKIEEAKTEQERRLLIKKVLGRRS